MPKLKDETIQKRINLYKENEEMIKLLYFIYQGNFIQSQARRIILSIGMIHNKIVNGKKKPYTERTFNNVFLEMEKLNLIDRRDYYDTHNKAVSFKKPLLCFVLGCDNDNISSSKNAFNNSTNEVFDVSLFKGYYFLSMYEQNKNKLNSISELVDFFKRNTNTLYVNEKDMLNNFYKVLYQKTVRKNIKDRSETENNYNLFANKIDQINRARNNQKETKNNFEIVEQKYKPCDLITLKKRKIFLTKYKESDNKLNVSFVLFCSTDNYSMEKLLKNLKETILSTYSFFGELYDRKNIVINILLLFYTKTKAENMYRELLGERFLNNREHTKFVYFDKMLKDETDISVYKNNIHLYFSDTKIANDYRGDCLRFNSKSTEPKKPTRKQLEAELKKKDEIINTKKAELQQLEEINQLLALVREANKKDDEIKKQENEIKRLREELAKRK